MIYWNQRLDRKIQGIQKITCGNQKQYQKTFYDSVPSIAFLYLVRHKLGWARGLNWERTRKNSGQKQLHERSI